MMTFAKSDNTREGGHLYINPVRGLGSPMAVLGNESHNHNDDDDDDDHHHHHHHIDHDHHDHLHHLDADQLVVIPMQERERPQLHN